MYYYDEDIPTYHFGVGHPMRPLRVRICHEMCEAYGLLAAEDVSSALRSPPHAQAKRGYGPLITGHEMTAYHADKYIDFLRAITPDNYDQCCDNGSSQINSVPGMRARGG